MSRGIHTKPNQGITHDWLTPPEIIKELGPFDLDPCCPAVMPWRTADLMLSREASDPGEGYSTKYVEDGLTAEWFGRVWLNPPYSAAACMAWLGKLADHGNGIALVAARTETEWFHRHIWERADAMLFLRGRLYYYDRHGQRAKGNAGHGSVLVAYRSTNAFRLIQSRLKGHRLRTTLKGDCLWTDWTDG